MREAAEYQAVSGDVFFWQAYEPAVKCDLSCCALRVGGGLVFVDPIPLADAALAELTAEAPPALIVLTNGNHARAAATMRDRFHIPIAAHADAAEEIAPDRLIADGDTLLAALTVITLPGAGPGEIALHGPGGVACIGDALIHLELHGLALLPDKYCDDAKLLRASLRKLLRFDFGVLTFAHGLPIVTDARGRLESLLA